MIPNLPRGGPLLLLCLIAGLLSLTSCTTTDLGANRTGGMAVGTWVTRLPSGAERIEEKGITYYRYGPDFYVSREGRFVVVSSPHSTMAEKRAMTRWLF
jgi:hypothetical protein